MSKVRYSKISCTVERLTLFSTLHRVRNIGRAALCVLAVALVLMGCPDSAGDNNGNDTTAPAAVSDVTVTPLPSGTEVLLQWTDSSSDDVTTITISWSFTVTGIMGGSDTVEVGTEESTIGGLDFATPYTFVITVTDAAGTSTAITPVPVSTLNPIDADGDTLIDINSLERLYNMRYNLDVGATGDDGRYKESTQTADDQGMLCGADAATPCSGYELTSALDFATSSSYDSDMVNDDWRPDNADPNMATNAGWPPIGSCNTNTDGTDGACGDDDDIPFAARFVGNDYTISNLYARNTNNSTSAGIGLFAAIDNAAIIDTVGVVDAFVYGSSADLDYVGGLVGFSDGSIIASYTSGSTADGGMGNSDRVGGLAGQNDDSISASYVNDSTADGGMGNTDRVGSLVGINFGTITASYVAGDSTADGGAGTNNNVGGLVGFSSGNISASYTSGSTANGGTGDGDSVGGLVGFNNGNITASYATNSMADGGMGDGDRVGGLVGESRTGTIAASYASGTANGGADNNNVVGGLVGDTSRTSTVIASYATAAADGGTGSGNTVGSLVGRNTITIVFVTSNGTITASYGFGTTDNVDTAGESGSSLPGGVTTAAQLTAPSSAAATAVDAEWNQAISSNTQNAWNFGESMQAPALRYADYDGDGDTYGCGSDSMATIVIPDSVPNGMGGTITVDCGTTLLPGQRQAPIRALRK